MYLKEHGDIAKAKTYEVELQIAEEVAEWGAYATTKKLPLPDSFDINDTEKKNHFKEKVKDLCEEKGYDTVVLRETVCTEYLMEVRKEG